jgi:hypothetical protein
MKAAWLAGKRHAELALMAGTDPFTEAALETEEGRQMLEKAAAKLKGQPLHRGKGRERQGFRIPGTAEAINDYVLRGTSIHQKRKPWEGICDTCNKVVDKAKLHVISTPTLAGVVMCDECHYGDNVKDSE